MEKLEVREGTTDRIGMQLLADDDAINLSVVEHVELHLKDRKGRTYRYSSNDIPKLVDVLEGEEIDGKVYLDPPSDLFVQIRSPYAGYWLVYDEFGKHYSVPEEGEFSISVRRLY